MDPIMNSQPIEVIDTRKLDMFKYFRIIHNGYLYYFHKKCTNHLRWRCNRVSLKCPAVLRTTMDMSEIAHIAVDHEHVHVDDLVAIQVFKMQINVLKQSFLSRRNTCFKLKDLDKVFEEIHLPENSDYKNENTEKHEKLMENTNSKDKIFNFENNPLNKLEQENNKNQIAINLEDGITKNHTSYSFNEELKNVNQICRATLPNEHNMTIDNNKQKNKSTLITNACRQTIPLKVKPRKYTSKFTNKNLPINTTTTISTPVLKSISTIGSLSSIKVTHNMIESSLNKNIDDENENISDSDDNNDDDDSSFGSDEANYNAVIVDDDDDDDDDEKNNIKLVLVHCGFWKTLLH